MSKETTVRQATPAMPAGASRVGPRGQHAGSAERKSGQTFTGEQAQDRIARRAYELYEQRGRQDGLAMEDWLQAERQLVAASV